MGSEKKHSSVKKYWIILALWFFLPMFIKNILKIQMPSSTLMFGFVPPYWLFVMATFAYERYVIMSYLKKKYPLEVKERKGKAVFLRGKSWILISSCRFRLRMIVNGKPSNQILRNT